MNYPKYEQASLRIMTHNVWNGNPGGRDARYPGFYAQYSPDILCLQEMSPPNLYPHSDGGTGTGL